MVINLSRFSQYVELDLSEFADMIPRELFSHNDFRRIDETLYPITIGPHGHFWFELRPASEMAEITTRPSRPLRLDSLPQDDLTEEIRDHLEERVLGSYIQRARWFGGKGRRIRSLSIVETIRMTR